MISSAPVKDGLTVTWFERHDYRSRVTDAEMRASRWLAVRVDVPVRDRQRGPWRQAGKALLRDALNPLNWLPGSGTPVLRSGCQVVVIRKDNGDILTRFYWDDLPGARRHEADLNARLVQASLAELCDDLGIPMEAVENADPID